MVAGLIGGKREACWKRGIEVGISPHRIPHIVAQAASAPEAGPSLGSNKCGSRVACSADSPVCAAADLAIRK